jgi:hypothetical protein
MTTTAAHLLAAARREFTVAKRWKRRQWTADAAASVAAFAVVAVPFPRLALVFVVAAAGLKLLARHAQSRSRSCARIAERARRYDFQRRALGWEIPHDEYADTILSLSGETKSLSPEERESLAAGYYEHEGPSGHKRMVANLHESVFWSKRDGVGSVLSHGAEAGMAPGRRHARSNCHAHHGRHVAQRNHSFVVARARGGGQAGGAAGMNQGWRAHRRGKAGEVRLLRDVLVRTKARDR